MLNQRSHLLDTVDHDSKAVSSVDRHMLYFLTFARLSVLLFNLRGKKATTIANQSIRHAVASVPHIMIGDVPAPLSKTIEIRDDLFFDFGFGGHVTLPCNAGT